MDIFIQNVPSNVNHIELRLFLQDELHKFDILACEVNKRPEKNFATVTVANDSNGQRFIDSHHERGRTPLIFQSTILRCRKSNKRGQPNGHKVMALLQKEEKMRTNRPNHAATKQTTLPTFPFQSLMTGIWSYNNSGELVFDQKFKDLRQGFVTFGKSGLVVYLENFKHPEYDWHGRIDIPYAIIVHTIPQTEISKRGSITLTLRSPPKIYKIETTNDLHLYTGKEANYAPPILLDMRRLSLNTTGHKGQTRRLERLCTLHQSHERNSALCMVYKLLLPDLSFARKAWAFLKDFSVPEKYWWKIPVPPKSTRSIEIEYAKFESALASSELDFVTKFQIQALVLEGSISPSKMVALFPSIRSLVRRNGDELVAPAIKKLVNQIPTPGPHVNADGFKDVTIQQILADNVHKLGTVAPTDHNIIGSRKKYHHLALTYKATITPTGLLLRGPDWAVSNRVLRKYSEHTECFMRVFCADEDGLSVFFDPRASQDHVYGRFRKILSEGILVAGRKYEFLGFSHASLRDHQAWFMAPFNWNGSFICARDVIRDLGDFRRIQCSAKCAARIGQAFSDTIFAVPVPSSAFVTESKDDIERNGRVFSDGCGTISLGLLKKVWKALPPERRKARPTVLQIRYRGAKGVLSLDTSLPDEQLHIRKSMTKYTAKEGWRDIELCGAGYRPLKMFLNHQFIKILEDLGVQPEMFLQVQNDACNMLEAVIRHPLNAASFLEYSHSGVFAKIPRLIELLHYIGLSFQTDKFLTDIIEVAAMASLRSLKYRARIPIENGCVLYGIMDEFNTLKEGEVYITMQQENDETKKSIVLIKNRVVVTRAPALHPGDMQIVSAVDVPADSPLKELRNCIVFSQQGPRDLPSQLSGGDLDGDQFHIIYDQRLIPDFTVPPADYTPIPPKDLGRPVEVNDIVDFFIEFMQMDRLGQISNKHKIRADRLDEGTRNVECKDLAQLASHAVDFSKSGVPADMTKIPLGADYIRPDFMAPGHALVLNDLGATELEELEQDDVDEPDSLSRLDPDKSTFRYYRSNKVLGKLYRNIDEKNFFSRMKDDFQTNRHSLGKESLLQVLERYIDVETRGILWDHHIGFAERLREYYEENMINIMDTLRAHRGKPLTELEVFSGNILGKKERASNRYINQANQEVRDRFDRDVSAITRKIIVGEEDWEGHPDDESLPRSIACFKVALETHGWENQVVLRSWKYVAAAVCLEQLWLYRGNHLRPL